MSAQPPLDPAITEPTVIHDREPNARGLDGRIHYGTVCVAAIVTVDGRLRDITVVRASDAVLREAAVQALKDWRYTPAMLDGKAIEVPYRVFVSVYRH